MRVSVKGSEVVLDLDRLEAALLHALARRENSRKVTKHDLQKAFNEAVDSYCRKVAATRAADSSAKKTKKK